MIGSSSNTININGVQHRQVNNFFNFSNNAGRTSAVKAQVTSAMQQQLVSQTSQGLSIGTSGTAVMMNGTAKRGQTTGKQDFSNHYTTFNNDPGYRSSKTNTEVLRISDIMLTGSQELNSTGVTRQINEQVTNSDIR